MKLVRLSKVSTRLLPLYMAAFFQGLPFWYAIEKLFMVEIGFNTATIGVMLAVASIVMLAVETPSGILADRWSRKGVMILGCFALMASAIVGALSYNEVVFIISTSLWGVYAALYSGTYDAVIYDTLVEERGNAEGFEKRLGYLRSVEGGAFVIAALLGGFIASQLGTRETFIISLPCIAVSLFFLWKFREPKLHKMEVSDPVFLHIRQTFAAVLRKRVLLPIVITIVGFGLLQETIFEFSQLWFIAANMPVALYGLFAALLYSSWAVGGLLAPYVRRKASMYLAILSVVASCFALALFSNYVVIAVSQFVFCVGLVALGILLTKKMHDELPSKLRAGSGSVVSTLARSILIPFSLLFTAYANSQTIFAASYILLGILAIAIGAFLLTSRGQSAKR
jgi:MFS family permease